MSLNWNENVGEPDDIRRQPRTNPDGDVDLRGANYNSFNVPSCRICEAKGEKPGMVCLY